MTTFSRLAAAVLVFGLTALAAGVNAQEFSPAIVFDMGGKFDKSFNEAAYNGAERFKKEHEGSFLVGMAAAMASRTGKVGFVGGMDIPLIRKFALGYKAVLLVSVELDEILALADRILVMHDGRIVGDVPRAEATEQAIGRMMAGLESQRRNR